MNHTKIPPGWTITRIDDKLFRPITVRAPNGYSAYLLNTERNPANVLYMLAEALLDGDGVSAQAPLPMDATPEMVQAACDALGYPGGDRSLYLRAWKVMAEHAPGVNACRWPECDCHSPQGPGECRKRAVGVSTPQTDQPKEPT